MKVLCIGDVVGDAGVECLRRLVPGLRRTLGANAVIVNGENADRSGTGISQKLADELLQGGFADVITTGNHCFRRAGTELFTDNERVLCPGNHPAVNPGCGVCRLDLGRYTLEVYNLQGTAFSEPLQNPFLQLEQYIKQATSKFRILDFHAEATAEKKAIAFYADGKLSAVFGTHTHVQTADEQILPGGTGYITDAGMTGPTLSVLGVVPELAVQRQMWHIPTHFDVADGQSALEGVLFTLEDATGKCVEVKRICQPVS